MTDQTQAETTPQNDQKPNENRTKPTKQLPTERIAFHRQLELLRGFAVASGPSNSAVTNAKVASIVNLTPSTLSLANAFFTDVGFLQRTESGFIPANEVISYTRAHEWDADTAAYKLAPILRATWFFEAIRPKLDFHAREKQEVLQEIADTCAAGKNHANRLGLLVEFLEAANLIACDGNMVRLVKENQQKSQSDTPAKGIQSEPAKPESKQPSPTGFAPKPTEGAVNFHVSVKVDMDELSGWPADRIAAFFSGIAQVLAAKEAASEEEQE